MNTLKLLYDVVRIHRNKEHINAVLTAHVQKDQEEVFSLRNVFAKNGAGAKSTASCELTLDGEKMKRESCTEISGADCCGYGRMLRAFCHRHHAPHHDGDGGRDRCSVKGLLSRISFVLGLFSSISSQEKEGGAAVISLNLNELPEELQTMLRDKLGQKADRHQHCGALAGCHSVASLNGRLLLTVNKAREIEQLSVQLESQMRNEKSEPIAVTATADVQFAW